MSSNVPTQPDGSRRTRFRRDTPIPMRLTHDDLSIVRLVAKHRFLRSTHIVRLMHGRSPKKIIERLGALYHNHYLDRPRAQLDYYAAIGSAPLVYGLGNRGADALREIDGTNRGEIDWTWKNRKATRVFIEHTLLTADVAVAAACISIARADVLVMDAATIVAHSPERFSTLPVKLTGKAQIAGRVMDLAVVPDDIIGLDFTSERKRKYFFVEADRGTMPVMRSDLEQTSIYRKLLTYLAGGGTDNTFGRQLGVGNFRVLFVTSSRERLQSMYNALQTATHGQGSSQFLFAERATLNSARDLLDVPWTSGKGETVYLAD